MNNTLNVKIFLIYAFLGFVSGKIWYEAQFTDSILSCDDFENKNIIADGIVLGMTEGSDGEEPGFGLSGPLCLYITIEDGFYVNLVIYKQTEIVAEYMFKSQADFCGTMKDPDCPWKAMLETLNMTSCPINTGCYTINNLVLSMDAFSDLLCRDFCGAYSVELYFTKDLEKISCHMIQVAIVERESDD